MQRIPEALSRLTAGNQASFLFDEYYHKLLRRRLNQAMLAAIFVVGAFAILDWVTFRKDFNFFLTLRLSTMAAFAVILICNRFITSPPGQDYLAMAAAATAAAMLEVMYLHGDANFSYYGMGIFLILIGVLALVPVKMRLSFALSGVCLVIFLVPLVIWSPPIENSQLWQRFFILLTGACLLILANRLQYKSLFRQFALRIQLEEKERILQGQARLLKKTAAQATGDLRRSEDLYRSLIKSNPSLVFTLGLKGEYTFLGPRCLELTGYSAQELMGKWFIRFVDPKDHEICIESFKQVRDQRRRPVEVKYRLLHKDGQTRRFKALTAPYRGPDGKVMGLIGTAVDETENHRMHQQSKQYRRSLERALGNLQAANFNIIKALAGAIEAKDPYTRGHAERVSMLAAAMAQSMGMGEEEIVHLQYAAVLHDVGKIGVRGAVLNKGGPLDPDELSHIQEHPAMGEAILRDIEVLSQVRPLIRTHHERIDGKGYPDGLAGDQIPLPSRILAVADAFDAMRSKRPYREPLELERALDQIRKGSGAQFDPSVVEAFLDLVENSDILSKWHRMNGGGKPQTRKNRA